MSAIVGSSRRGRIAATKIRVDHDDEILSIYVQTISDQEISEPSESTLHEAGQQNVASSCSGVCIFGEYGVSAFHRRAVGLHGVVPAAGVGVCFTPIDSAQPARPRPNLPAGHIDLDPVLPVVQPDFGWTAYPWPGRSQHRSRGRWSGRQGLTLHSGSREAQPGGRGTGL